MTMESVNHQIAMLKEETNTGLDGRGTNNWVHVCDSCERAPAAFLCKADSASLCTSCDLDIHSANPLARRHQRVPILPIPGSVYGPTTNNDDYLTQEPDETIIDEDDEDETASWLLLKNGNNHNDIHALLFGDDVVDDYLDLDEYNSSQDKQFDDQYGNQKSYNCDSVVPVQCDKGKDQVHQQFFQLGMEYEASNNGYGYPAAITHSVSVSSMEVGVVPEPTISEGSISYSRPPKGTIDLFSSPASQMPTQLTPIDREARVLRYREKKKTRKFEKTIRYASRKAYAETRPRIKGRFAKRTDVRVEVDQMFSVNLIAEGRYGVVPLY